MTGLTRGFREGWSAARLTERGVVAAGVAGAVLAALALIAAQIL